MMTTLKVMEFKETILSFVKADPLPAEVKRLCLKEIYEEVQKDALQEAMNESMERSK